MTGPISSYSKGVKEPIFVVGAPRSGTSILACSLAQHPNIVALANVNWLTTFAAMLESLYDLGTRAAGREQLNVLGITRADFFDHFGRSAMDLLMGHDKQTVKQSGPPLPFQQCHCPRSNRWVTGSSHYCSHISGLARTFPDAKFIHIWRDVH